MFSHCVSNAYPSCTAHRANAGWHVLRFLRRQPFSWLSIPQHFTEPPPRYRIRPLGLGKYLGIFLGGCVEISSPCRGLSAFVPIAIKAANHKWCGGPQGNAQFQLRNWLPWQEKTAALLRIPFSNRGLAEISPTFPRLSGRDMCSLFESPPVRHSNCLISLRRRNSCEPPVKSAFFRLVSIPEYTNVLC